ncbi:hypothetical protein [Azospirillum halopraeferens]|uniref:hypothetical protein n=1 Tax=Azospirillum halopraeferens TaxID=34010 RepID=UPI0003F566FF|nr:hypothetical protein [Azospirillum halopraeferens]
MGMTIPNASDWKHFRITGTTSELGKGGLSTDYRQFTVSKSGEFNFRLNNSYTSLKIVNNRNEVIVDAKSAEDVATASARLQSGTYTAVISQQFRGVNGRPYELEVSQRSSAMVLASGATLTGTARDVVGNDPGVQKHSLNVVQGGEFNIDFSLPYSRWAIMGKEGKVIASGDTMKPGETTDFMKKTAHKLEPGEYEVIIVPPKNTNGQEIPFRLTFVPKTASVDPDAPEERPMDRILREREERLRRWASEDAEGGSSNGKPFKMTLAMV